MRYRQSPRLKGFNYTGSHAYFLTMVTRERQSILRDSSNVSAIESRLQDACSNHGVTLWAYTFMPDHLHLLVQGRPDARITEFVRQFKQTSGYDHRRRTGKHLWQISYHDRVLRSEESLADVARYIWANPVRAGLCEDYRHFPFSGPRPLPEMPLRQT